MRSNGCGFEKRGQTGSDWMRSKSFALLSLIASDSSDPRGSLYRLGTSVTVVGALGFAQDMLR